MRDTSHIVDRIASRTSEKGLWDRVKEKRERGESPAKPGEADYPEDKVWKKLTKKAADEKFTPPKSAQNAAKKALKWKEEHGNEVKAMTLTGWTRARQLANGDSLSYDIVKRIAQFNRHRKNSTIAPEKKSEPWKDNGHVAWLGWGGTSGVDWAIGVVSRVEKAKSAAIVERVARDVMAAMGLTR